MSILIAYGSKLGGTEELATMLAAALRQEGHDVDVLAARCVRHVEGYDAVIVGGALYAFRWHRDARRFVKHHARALQERPTYFFSSGPLDDSATQREIPPVRMVQTLMGKVGARGHVTFGGRLAPDARGFPAGNMAKKHAGDWRDPAQVRAWAHTIAQELPAPVPAG